MQEGAIRMETGFEDAVVGAQEGTYGAVSAACGKLRGKPAVSVQHALDLLDAGDVDGARRVLSALVEAP